MSERFVAHDYQMHCIKRTITDRIIGLLLEMGLGKTVIVLTAINDLKFNRFAFSKCLIIAPKKVAEATWQKEAAKWDHTKHLRINTVLGSEKQRIRALNTPGDIFVVNRENVVWLVEYYRNAWPFTMVVVDESTSFKSPKAKRFKALTWVRAGIERMVILTGTPAPKGLLDLWAQVFLLDEGQRLGKKQEHFKERYFEPDARDRDRVYSYCPKPGADDVIHRLLGDICISMRTEDYLKLPDCLYVSVPVVLDDKAKAQYKKMERDMLLEVDGAKIDAATAATLTGKLLQLCNGACYTEDGAAIIEHANGRYQSKRVIEVHDCKIEAFLELVEALNGKSALVFYSYQHDIDRIMRALEPQTGKQGLRVRKYTGPQDADDWNEHKIDIMLAHPASCAYGLNLQHGGNHVIWFGLTWSLELYQQANARLHRQGQTGAVFIHHLVVEGGVDQDVMATLDDRGKTQNKFMDALKVRIDRVQREG